MCVCRLYFPLSLNTILFVLSSHTHKAAVHCVKWNRNGNWFLSASKDSLIKVYDIRVMKEMYTLKGHKKEVNSK